MKKITKVMGNYSAEISFSPTCSEWKGVIWDNVNYSGTCIYINYYSNLDKLLELIDEMLCFYNNTDLELTNKILPKGWHLEKD